MPSNPEPDDGLEEMLEEMVRDGELEAEGEGKARRYWMTEKGNMRVEQMLRLVGVDPDQLKGTLRRKP